ncbi:hypothetical protein [Micromonospora musae]|uniref:hypothetical protein n=1 Tax=Micromonospora musae TaxID=1894970 RepID=UPI0033F3A452
MIKPVSCPAVSHDPDPRSIYGFLQVQLAEGSDLDDVVLPAEEHVAGQLKFASGAWDGVVSHHVAIRETDIAGSLFAAVKAAAAGGWLARRQFARLYERAKSLDDLLSAIDPLLGRIRESSIDGGRRQPGLYAGLAGGGPIIAF